MPTSLPASLPKPHRYLGVGSGTQAEQLARGVLALDSVLRDHPPNAVLVVGDTNAGLAGALASVKRHVPVVHYEAGVGSHDWRMPEEINRRVIDAISRVCFAPTKRALATLQAEGLGRRSWEVGDTLSESVARVASDLETPGRIRTRFNLGTEQFVLATVHRAENTDIPTRLHDILTGLATAGVTVLFPMHPRTTERAAHAGVILGAHAS